MTGGKLYSNTGEQAGTLFVLRSYVIFMCFITEVKIVHQGLQVDRS